eukprot:TRINITY_DN76551_c0_g1_i1.p1 TRINITY_DN76551_c0_g1~~TRINITY_DN76551_c0_g1_i1.p1  ORF type:complete len:106 (-),score=10.14 TRINITY_DN76551_c0_g1_i1:230-547(-)
MSERCQVLVEGRYRYVEVGDKIVMCARDGPVYFCQDGICAVFRSGIRVKTQWAHWMCSSYDIETVIHHGQLYSLNNRTFFVAKQFDQVGNPVYLNVAVVDELCDW